MSRIVPNARPSIILPLQPGDRLTRAEFERRYDATPGLKKAELIEGVVYMPPPVSHRDHSKPHVQLGAVLATYAANTPGVDPGDNGSVRLDLDNMPQPDLYLMIEEKCGGQAKVDEEDYVSGAPELVAEIAASSASYDLHDKLKVYRRTGVREYIVWRTLDREIDYFILREGLYERMLADENGIWRSECFPGFWLDGNSLLAGDPSVALEVLRQGIASPEHVEFVKRLDAK